MNRLFRRFFAVSLVAAALLSASSTSFGADSASRWQRQAERFLRYDQTNPPVTGGVVFTGSSSIEMWRTLHADFPDLPVVNRGIGGTWLADLSEFAPKLVYPLKPRTVVVYAGENDLADGRSVDQVVAAFEEVRAQIHREAPSARIIFLSLKPSVRRVSLLPAMREANTRIAAACEKEPRCTFVDIFTPMLDEQGQPRPELFIEDKLHMTAAGYAIWTKIVGPVLHETR